MYLTLCRRVLRDLAPATLLLAFGSVLEAQDVQTNAPEPASSLNEVVVTGTLIRGIAPPSANLISLDPTAIAATGASNTNEVLNNIPQLGDFGNTNAQVSRTNSFLTVVRPNIRNLPGLTVSGGSTTLLLVDGHRLVGVGIQETAPDPNIIPPSLLERVEILPDGGSSTYGADAIGGAINFIMGHSILRPPSLRQIHIAKGWRTIPYLSSARSSSASPTGTLTSSTSFGSPPVGSPSTFFSSYGTNYTMAPTQAQVNALVSQVPNGTAQVAPYFLPGSTTRVPPSG
jgi:hypothetical protein